MNTAPAGPPLPDALPEDVQALLGHIKRLGKKRADFAALTETDFVIAACLYQGAGLQEIAVQLGMTRQAVHRRKGVIRDTLQAWFFLTYDHDDAEIRSYRALYQRIR